MAYISMQNGLDHWAYFFFNAPKGFFIHSTLKTLMQNEFQYFVPQLTALKSLEIGLLDVKFKAMCQKA
ncbi:hypothetical protein A6U85_04645 [Agrobacterium sp. 13-626]|nr:hypothetical protein PMI03_01261 [Rhizobium sp. AP16]KEA06947.1 hypothetical protein CN09_08195 [Rhizobium rhizogenes]MQB29497.1 hypothetical protein [Rhizobium rhizogenes]OCJ06247.1 hypothetical protein A6U85_04645 [Agrobacterium sp. 13-626]